MSLTPEEQRKVIDYYFQEPNAGVLGDGLGSNRQDVVDFLKMVYEFLIKLHPGEVDPHGIADDDIKKFGPRKTGDVGIGVSATTEDMKVLYGRKAPKT